MGFKKGDRVKAMKKICTEEGCVEKGDIGVVVISRSSSDYIDIKFDSGQYIITNSSAIKKVNSLYLTADQTFYVIIFVLSLAGLIFSSNDVFDILLFLSFIAVSFLGYAEEEK